MPLILFSSELTISAKTFNYDYRIQRLICRCAEENKVIKMADWMIHAGTAFGIGLFLGCAYARGAMLEVGMGKFAGWILTLAIVAAVCFSSWSDKVLVASSLVAGIALYTYWSCKRLESNIPFLWMRPLSRDAWADGHTSVPQIYGNLNIGWSLVYSDGMSVQYDTLGRITAFHFADGTHWDMSEADTQTQRTPQFD